MVSSLQDWANSFHNYVNTCSPGMRVELQRDPLLPLASCTGSHSTVNWNLTGLSWKLNKYKFLDFLAPRATSQNKLLFFFKSLQASCYGNRKWLKEKTKVFWGEEYNWKLCIILLSHDEQNKGIQFLGICPLRM